MTSSLRSQHADVTRSLVARAAADLFVEQGYAKTSIREVAAKAGVAVQTIYSTFGSKAGLALALVEVVDETADLASFVAELAECRDPDRLVVLLAKVERTVEEANGRLLGVLRKAAFTEPEIGRTVVVGEGRRAQNVRRIVERLHESGDLRGDVESAVTLVEGLLAGLGRPRLEGAAVPGPEPDEHERLLVEGLGMLLLGRIPQ